MAGFYCKMLETVLLFSLYIASTHGFVNDTFKVAVHKAIEHQCNQWFNPQFIETTPILEFKRRPLVSVTFALITPDNVENYFSLDIASKVMKKYNFGNNVDDLKGIRNILIKCQAAYPVSMIITSGFLPQKNDFKQVMNDLDDGWETIDSPLRVLFTANTMIQLTTSSAPMVLYATCNQKHSSTHLSRFRIIFQQDKYLKQGRLDFKPDINIDKDFYVEIVSEVKASQFCLPMYPSAVEEDWLYKSFTPSSDDAPINKNLFPWKVVAIVIFMNIVIMGGFLWKSLHEIETANTAM